MGSGNKVEKFSRVNIGTMKDGLRINCY